MGLLCSNFGLLEKQIYMFTLVYLFSSSRLLFAEEDEHVCTCISKKPENTLTTEETLSMEQHLKDMACTGWLKFRSSR